MELATTSARAQPLYGAERRKAAGHSDVNAASLAERTYGPAEADPYISAPYPRSGIWRIIREAKLSEEMERKSAAIRLSSIFPRIIALWISARNQAWNPLLLCWGFPGGHHGTTCHSTLEYDCSPLTETMRHSALLSLPKSGRGSF